MTPASMTNTCLNVDFDGNVDVHALTLPALTSCTDDDSSQSVWGVWLEEITSTYDSTKFQASISVDDA